LRGGRAGARGAGLFLGMRCGAAWGGGGARLVTIVAIDTDRARVGGVDAPGRCLQAD